MLSLTEIGNLNRNAENRCSRLTCTAKLMWGPRVFWNCPPVICTLREAKRALRDAVSQNQQDVMAVKTHWDCAKPALSDAFVLAEGDGSVDGRVET